MFYSRLNNVAGNSNSNLLKPKHLGLFYLTAEIRLLSCFHLHHFARSIELDWLRLQEGDS